MISRRRGVALLIGDTQNGWLVRRRPESGLWAGFYEIPWGIGGEYDDYSACLQTLRGELGITTPCEETELEETLRFTRWQVRVRLWRTSAVLQFQKGTEIVSSNSLLKLAMPTGLKRLVTKALTH